MEEQTISGRQVSANSLDKRILLYTFRAANNSEIVSKIGKSSHLSLRSFFLEPSGDLGLHRGLPIGDVYVLLYVMLVFCSFRAGFPPGASHRHKSKVS